jgi:hypothetical protein
LLKQVEEVARRDGVSVDQWVSAAVAEKVAALVTTEVVDQRARRGDRALFDRVLSRIPDAEPDGADGIEGP